MRYGFFDETSQSIRLWQCLTVELGDPLWRTVCRDHHKRTLLIICLSDCRCEIQQCRTTGDTDSHRL